MKSRQLTLNPWASLPTIWASHISKRFNVSAMVVSTTTPYVAEEGTFAWRICLAEVNQTVIGCNERTGLSHVIGQDEVTGRIEELVHSNAHANPEAPWSYQSETWESQVLRCSLGCTPVAQMLLIWDVCLFTPELEDPTRIHSGWIVEILFKCVDVWN